MDAVTDVLISLAMGAGFFVELLLLVLLGKLAKDYLTDYELDEQLTHEDNPAVALSFGGYLAGMLIALSGVFEGTGVSYVSDVIGTAVWGVFAIAALALSRLVLDRFVLPGFANVEELIRDRNIGVGACEAGGYVAAGLIIRASVIGEGAWWIAPVLLVLGLLTLMLGGMLLRNVVFRKYDIVKEIEKDNHAAGVLFGLHLAAFGYLVHAALAATAIDSYLGVTPSVGTVFEALGLEVIYAVIYLVVGALGLVVLTAITDRLMLPKHKLQDEIVADRNVGAALVAGVVAVFGSMLVMMVF